MTLRTIAILSCCLSPAAALAACGTEDASSSTPSAATALPQGSEPVDLDPAEFTTEIDNP